MGTHGADSFEQIGSMIRNVSGIEDFFSSQLEEWSEAAARYDALGGVEVKDIAVGDRIFRAQYNPARILSTSAKVDAASLSVRPCFLCAENRPACQRGMDLGNYELLVNPFPIFPRHFTIPAKRHIAQSIVGRMADMAALAGMMPGYTVFYNGPRCGASAPDHMHFQAGNTDFLSMPVPGHALSIATGSGWGIYAYPYDAVPFIRIKAATPQSAAEAFDRLYRAADIGTGEPMMNILCTAVPDSGVEIDVIPRKAHRPDFYGDASGRILVSPASVDLAGVFIFPRKQDFDCADDTMILRTLQQVCLSSADLKNWLKI